MPYVTTNDYSKLYFKDWGSPSHTHSPVILIHGWPLSADSWDDQAMALAEAGHQVIAYDRRGFGRSSQPWIGYDYDTLADDLAAVLDQTGVQNAVLVGFSMGGGEVARYMTRHSGASIAKTILVSSVLPYRLKTANNPLGTEQSAFDATALALKTDRAQFFTGFFNKFFGVGGADEQVGGEPVGGEPVSSEPVSSELLEWARGIAMQASLKATVECVNAFATTDFRADLAAFTVPTLIIHGTEDQTVPIAASARLAARGIVDASLIEYDGAPHGLFATHKDRLTKDLLDFIT